MVNRCPNYVVDLVHDLVKEGASIRQVMARAGIAKNTAWTYIQRFRDDAPPCLHGLNIYDCRTCCNSKRVRSGSDVAIYSVGRRLGVAAKEGPHLADSLTEALREVLHG